MQSLKGFSIYTKKVLTSREAFAIRANALALGIDEKVMEENAGYAIAATLRRKYKGEAMLFVCGTGGKGAIGLSAARHMFDYADVKAVLLGDPESVHNRTTKFNYRMLNDLMEVECMGAESVKGLEKGVKASAHVIDAIVGIGIKGRPSSLVAGAIKAINENSKNTISIDIPSGLDPDTGVKNTACIRADELLALHKMKKGAEQGGRSIDRTMVVDIGIPLSAELFAGPGDVMVATEPRLSASNKYSHGNVLVIGGSEEYSGAPLLAAFAAENALAALMTGSGYVTVAAPKKVTDICSKISQVIVTKEIRQGDGMLKDIQLVKTVKHDAAVIGPGLGNSEATYKAIGEVLEMEKGWGKPLVVDATAVHVLRRYKSHILPNIIVTPHEGEFKALTGINLANCTLDDKAKKVINFAKNYSCTIVLKGHDTIITNGDILKINRAKTPALATMGTGDVLSGIIAAYAASHKDPFESAVAGVYVHSKIADALYVQKGVHITAQDIINGIPNGTKMFDVIK